MISGLMSTIKKGEGSIILQYKNHLRQDDYRTGPKTFKFCIKVRWDIFKNQHVFHSQQLVVPAGAGTARIVSTNL